ncbi:MAG: LytTR family DNA-binding domain-containing protein [bacterium]|nr:LytTR family DNA-binding domain-containing protein [bacterium]
MKFKCLIVDDDERSSWLLKTILEEIEDIEVAGTASDGQKALEMAEDVQPDIVFMDIVMPGMNGMDASVKLKKGRQLPLVAFVSGYTEYIPLGYDFNGADYILKPFIKETVLPKVERLKESVRVIKESSFEYICSDIDRLRENLKAYLSGIIRIQTKAESFKNFRIRDIISFYSRGGHLFMRYGSDEPQRVMPTMKDMAAQMAGYFFVQVHRGHLINMQRISDIEHYGKKAYRIYVDDGSIVPVGRNYIKTIREIEDLRQIIEKGP